MFDKSEYLLPGVPENTEIGLILTQIIVTDGDSEPPNNIFMYSFGSGESTYNS